MSITIPIDTTVLWRNDGVIVHTVTSGTNPVFGSTGDGDFHSGDLLPGETFSVTFDEAGTFTYFCNLHPNRMAGATVVVEG